MSPVRVSTIAPGNTGILQTAQRMLAFIRTPSRAVARQLSAILGGAAPASTYATALEIYTWVQRHLQYTEDGAAPDASPWEAGQEGLRSPDYLLRGILNKGFDWADCDDYVILMGALLHAAGIPLALVLTSARPDREYDHVFLRTETDLGTIYADAIKGEAFGWHVPREIVTAWTEILV